MILMTRPRFLPDNFTLTLIGVVLLASFGAAAAYGADVASYVFVIAALVWWKRPKAEASALNEQFFGAFRAGLRYARSSRELHVVLLRAASSIFCAWKYSTSGWRSGSRSPPNTAGSWCRVRPMRWSVIRFCGKL